jgi:hypothetical protein
VQSKIYKYYKQWILFCCMLNMLQCYKTLKQNIWNLYTNNQQFLYLSLHTCLHMSFIMNFSFLCDYLPTCANLLWGLVWLPWILVSWTWWKAKKPLHENDLLASSHYNRLNMLPMQCAIKIMTCSYNNTATNPQFCVQDNSNRSLLLDSILWCQVQFKIRLYKCMMKLPLLNRKLRESGCACPTNDIQGKKKYTMECTGFLYYSLL